MPLARKDGEQYTITNIQGTHCREQVLRMGFAKDQRYCALPISIAVR